MFSNVKVFGTKDLNPANVLLRNFQDSGSMGNKDNHNIQWIKHFFLFPGIVITGGEGNGDNSLSTTEVWSPSGQFHCSIKNTLYKRHYHTQNKFLGMVNNWPTFNLSSNNFKFVVELLHQLLRRPVSILLGARGNFHTFWTKQGGPMSAGRQIREYIWLVGLKALKQVNLFCLTLELE